MKDQFTDNCFIEFGQAIVGCLILSILDLPIIGHAP